MTQTALTTIKTFKLVDSLSIYPPISQHSEKIKPITINYTKVQNCKITRTKLAIRGYKCFSKLSAAGPDTSLILRNVVKSRSLKSIHKLEFDPYLCEKSHLKDLCKVLNNNKSKHVKKFNFVLRRADYINESDILAPYISRLRRVHHARLELPRTENIDNKGIVNLATMYGKLYSLKSAEEVFPQIEGISDWAFGHFAVSKRRLAKLRKFKKTFMHYSTSKYDLDPHGQLAKKMKRCSFLEDLCLKVGYAQGWLSMNTSVDETCSSYMRMLPNHKNLKRLGIQFRNLPEIHDSMAIISEILPNFAELKYLSLEFLNSRMSETEIVLFAQSLVCASQIEHIDFKVLQYPNVSEECIFYFISVLSRLKNIKSFNAYFRRLTFSEEIMKELVDRTIALGKVGCCKSKQSIHFFKHSQ